MGRHARPAAPQLHRPGQGARHCARALHLTIYTASGEIKVSAVGVKVVNLYMHTCCRVVTSRVCAQFAIGDLDARL